MRHVAAVTQPEMQYDADQQVRKVTVLFTAAANTLESMNWVLVVLHCGMLPSEQDVQFAVTYGGYRNSVKVQYSTTQHSTVQHSTAQYSIVQYSTVQ